MLATPVASLDVLQKTGRDEDSHGDEMKLRADSPAIIDYVCILKNCKRGGKKKEDCKGEGEWVTWEQEKGNRGIMDGIQTAQCSTICSSCDDLVKDVFQCIYLATAYARVVLKQRPPGLGRNRGQIEEMVETEKELYKKAKSGEEVRIGMDPLRRVCPTEKGLV